MKENEIRVRKPYFSLNEKNKKKYVVILEEDTNIFFLLSDRPFLVPSCRTLSENGTYPSVLPYNRFGMEGIFKMEKESENLYRVSYPRK